MAASKKTAPKTKKKAAVEQPKTKKPSTKPAAAAEAAPKAAPKAASRTAPVVTSQQLINVLTLQGLSGFVALLDSEQPSVPVLKKAKELLDFSVAQPESAFAGRQDILAALDAHVTSRGLNLIPSRGRQPPVAGDKRRYRIQQLSDGSPFIRLAMTSLGLPKGADVVVEFGASSVTVRPAHPVDAPDVDVEAEEEVDESEAGEEEEVEEADEE